MFLLEIWGNQYCHYLKYQGRGEEYTLLTAVSLLALPMGATVSKGWSKVNPILLLHPSLSSVGLLEGRGSLLQWQREKVRWSCSSQEHLWPRWPWPPEIVMRPSFLYVLVFGINHFRPPLNPSNLFWQLCHPTHCIKFLCMKCWERVYRFSWSIPDWYLVKCPLKIQFEEVSLSNLEWQG